MGELREPEPLDELADVTVEYRELARKGSACLALAITHMMARHPEVDSEKITEATQKQLLFYMKRLLDPADKTTLDELCKLAMTRHNLRRRK